MHAAAKQHNAQYLHVLQPNQYYSRKDFSDAERRLAIDLANPYAAPVRQQYPELVAKSKLLSNAGVNFLDATKVFDEVNGIIYADTCCHYNERGNKILIDRIIEALDRQ